MTSIIVVSVVLFVLPFLFWIVKAPRLRTIGEMTQLFGPREMANILDAINRQRISDLSEFIQPTLSLFEGDQLFWSASGKLRGARQRRDKAALLLEFCQRLEHDGYIESGKAKFLMPMVLSVTLFTCGAFIEEPIRKLVPGLPHGCARIALDVYSEMEASVRAMLAENYPDGLEMLDAVL